MAERVRLAIVGCGGMGRRHLAGLAELARSDHNNVELIAVCDLNGANANALADEANDLLGHRPQIFPNIKEMLAAEIGLEAASCTTETGTHHIAATELLEGGIHTLCEKPLALTMRGCRLAIDAAQQGNAILSVAENFRRDPINRLVRALLDDGAIGDRQFIMETGVRGRDNLFITPWRHQKLRGALTLDAGVHSADILQYYFGDPATRLRPDQAVRADPRHPRNGWAGRLLRKMGRIAASHRRSDRRGRYVRPDHLRQWHARAMDRPLRRPRPTV